MSLEPNTLLLHYQVLEQIGAGGMGEVYRATFAFVKSVVHRNLFRIPVEH